MSISDFPIDSGTSETSSQAALSRRSFICMTAAAAVATGLTPGLLAAEPRNGIPYRTLGRTGEKISLVGLGGFHIGTQFLERTSIAIIRAALDAGINFLDNCWDYNDGKSEVRMGKALRDGYREKAFLMSKIDGQDRQTAAKQIDESLQRLQTDCIDLMQQHEIIRPEDPEKVFAPGGAIEALQEARKAGKIRYIGFTGHKSPEIHLGMLEVAAKHGFRFDSVQMPLNVMDAHFESFEKKVLPVLLKQEIAVLGMKPFGGGLILKSKTVEPRECLHYAMNLPTSVVITGCEEMERLEQAIEAAKSFKPMSNEALSALLAKSAGAAAKGEFEQYKVSDQFDGTKRNPEWLGPVAA